MASVRCPSAAGDIMVPRNEIALLEFGTKSSRRVSLRVRRGFGLVMIRLSAPRWNPGVGSGYTLSRARPFGLSRLDGMTFPGNGWPVNASAVASSAAGRSPVATRTARKTASLRWWSRATPVGTIATPRSTILNIGAMYVLGQQHLTHIVTVEGYNLTNEVHRLHTSFIKDLAPEMGRGIKATYSVKFF